MSEDKSPVTIHNGLGWMSLLGVAFILAKVFGVEPVASWSWFWVLAPFWVGWLIVISILLVFFLVWIAVRR